MNNIFIVALFLCFTGLKSSYGGGGKVYLVIGSDTAIWDGMNTSQYHCYYDQSLYTDPVNNASIVMNPSFRQNMIDSYGQPIKLTWWMMAGNIFRYATNSNIPVQNTMTLYLMKKYHDKNIILNGDELSLHYHTFHWSDYDMDGKFYWNQSKTFLECLEDFKFTLAQFLLEEELFPVSFRSGWHYMDNDWQNYLDQYILPYSMHNDFPAKRLEDTEPIDNIFDWSQAPSVFVPYNPSKENYQIPGNGPGWQVRSASFQKVRANDLMRDVFSAANEGIDQVACFWAHLPENDFPENLMMIDSLANYYANIYPEVKFKYCNAVEAMQLWRGNRDTLSPDLQLNADISGSDIFFNISVNEKIFQKQPFIAVKNIYNEYNVLECVSTHQNEWRTLDPIPFASLVKVGVAVCDTLGNQTNKFISYLPADNYIDNLDNGFNEELGDWKTSENYSWGTDSRYSILSGPDSSIAVWQAKISKSHNYNVFVQFPDISNRAEQIDFNLVRNGIKMYTVKTNKLLPPEKWNYLGTVELIENDDFEVKILASGENQNGKLLVADVLKISAFIKDKDIYLAESIVDLGDISVDDTVQYLLKISNLGNDNLTISDIYSNNILLKNKSQIYPVIISKNSSVRIPLLFHTEEIGLTKDTLFIISDDPRTPTLKKTISANVLNYFHTIDDQDSDQYQEFGDWRTSVANIYGPTSRYAFLNSNPLASARFSTKLLKQGFYEIQGIVPETKNSTDDALYEIYLEGKFIASYQIDQNIGSGEWIVIGNTFIPQNATVELWIKDSGNSTRGDVIRADAVKFQWISDEPTDIIEKEQMENKFQMFQNYPNPFNPVTKIKYVIPKRCNVNLSIFDVLGKRVVTLVDRVQNPGAYEVEFNARSINSKRLSSGIYFYKINAGAFTEIRKCILIK